MFVVRNRFTAKPGNASKLAKLLKDVMSDQFKGGKVRIMTDHVGAMNTVVMEQEVANLAEFEKMLQEYGEKPDVRERMKGYTELYESGVREIYRVH